MFKKTTFFLMVWAAIPMLFAAYGAIAGEVPVEMSCTLVTDCGNECWSPTPYTITFGGQAINGGTSTWTYTLSSNFPSGQNQLVLLTPVCSPDIGVGLQSGGQILPPGEGDSTTNFGVGNFQEYVVRVAAANPYVYKFTTAVPTPLLNTSMQLKSGKTLYFCQNIAGPACAEASYVPVPLYSEQRTGNYTLCIEKDPVTGCPTSIIDCTSGTPGDNIPIYGLSEIEIKGGHLKWTSAESDSRCKSVIFYTESTSCTSGCSSTNNCYGIPPCCSYSCPRSGDPATYIYPFPYKNALGRVVCGCRATCFYCP